MGDIYLTLSVKEMDELFRLFGKEVNEHKWRPLEYGLWKRLDSRLKCASKYDMFGVTIEDGEVELTFEGTDFLTIPSTSGFSEFLIDELSYYQDDYGCYVKEKENKVEKENTDMKGFNFDFGPCTNDGIKMSMYGIALRNAAGNYVSYDKKSGDIIDVDCLNFDGGQFLFKMPVAVKDIKVGDVVIHNKTAMFVTSVDNGVSVVDIRAGEIKTIIPTKSMFGFDFITKIVSMFDAVSGAPSPSEPFGNMLPFLMLQDGKMDTDTMLAMMMMNGKTDFTSNPMMLYFLMSKDGKSSNSLLPLAFMMSNSNGNYSAKSMEVK